MESITQTATETAVQIAFSITHNISSSKGWGRYKATCEGKPLVMSSTGNQWVYADHSGSAPEGSPIVVTLQICKRAKKSGRETMDTTDYGLIVAAGQTATLGTSWDLQVVVEGARNA